MKADSMKVLIVGYNGANGSQVDARRTVEHVVGRGAKLLKGHRVDRVVTEGKRAAGVLAVNRGRRMFLPADLVVLAAGGMGSPVILQKSGIPCEDRLFVDP